MQNLFTKEFDLKAAESADGEVVAYLTTFKNADQVGDIIETGALDKFVQAFDPETKKLPMLFNHNSSSIVGEWKTLEIDDYGVKGTGILYTETSLGKDIQSLLKRKAVAAVSIGFKSNDYETLKTGGRKFKSIDLVETSIVLNPANKSAVVLSVKSDDGFIETKALKAVLKEAGLNRDEIEALFQQGWKGLKNLRNENAATEEFVAAIKQFKL
ncbi:MAG: HK97 family phage prohead protease [Acinetobacter sp.]|uniref:HK97 family phage prohead protease n=1 Tax=Acinetobacter sp. TaxID=472 RepID=UPI00391B628B